ncbi:hypothetical protein C8Q70DRAFT_934497 [Cubamyces menziesii]|nr:hypothetical protein C8Q70DRAFT_934497 [Cubamyces menziesii]
MPLDYHTHLLRSASRPLSDVNLLRDALSLPFIGETTTEASTIVFSTIMSFTSVGTAVGSPPDDASGPTATVRTTASAAGTPAPNSEPTSTTLAVITDTAGDNNSPGTWTDPATTTAAADDSDPGDQQNQWTSTTTDTSTPTSVDSTSSSSIPDTVTSETATTAISVTSSTLSSITSATVVAQSIMPSPTAATSKEDQHGISTTTIVEVVAICLACLCALILALLLWRVLRRRKRESMSFGDSEIGSVAPADMAAPTDVEPHVHALPSTNYSVYGEDPRRRQMSLAIDTVDTGSDTLQSGYGKHDPSSYDTPTDEAAEINSPMRMSSSTLSYIDALCPETAQPPAASSTPTTLPRYVPQSRPLPVPEGLDSPFASIYSVEERTSTAGASIPVGSVEGHAGDAYPRPMAVYGSVLGRSSLSLDNRASWVIYEEQPPPMYSQY